MGAVVLYVKLLGAIDPTRVGKGVTVTEAPPEVKDVVTRIRRAFKSAECSYKVENVRCKGYRLRSSNE